MDKVADNRFHKSRVAFVEVEGKTKFLKNSDMSHKEWVDKEFGITDEEFEKMVRGYIKDGEIYLYVGKGFRTTPELESRVRELTVEICKETNMERPKAVYCGMNVGKVGEVWTPIKRIEV